MKFSKGIVVLVTVMLLAGGTAVCIAAVTKKKDAPIPGDQTKNVAKQVVPGKARNVILLIGDGMDETAVTAARNYQLGAAGRLNMDKLRLAGSVTTYALNELMGTREPSYVTDSAASATAWSTGQKTGLLRISSEAFTNRPLPTISELAKKQGYRVGNVTNDSLTGATPAAQMSHVRLRSCSSPQDTGTCGTDAKSRGGLGAISEQAADSKLDLLFGGGMNDFDDSIEFGPDAGKTVVESAQRQGFELVTNWAGLGTYTGNKRLLGLFAPGNLSSEWSGQNATQGVPAAQRCETGKRPANEPPLSSMTNHAISYLNKRSKGKKKGFFLQVEGADIDKGAHAADPCRMIGGLIAFDKAVEAAVKFAKRSPKTLVIVSADHGQSSQILPFRGGARTARLITNEGGTMFLGYGTARNDDAQEHAGITVPVRAMGPQAANLTGLKNQTDIFRVITGALGIKP